MTKPSVSWTRQQTNHTPVSVDMRFAFTPQDPSVILPWRKGIQQPGISGSFLKNHIQYFVWGRASPAFPQSVTLGNHGSGCQWTSPLHTVLALSQELPFRWYLGCCLGLPVPSTGPPPIRWRIQAVSDDSSVNSPLYTRSCSLIHPTTIHIRVPSSPRILSHRDCRHAEANLPKIIYR